MLDYPTLWTTSADVTSSGSVACLAFDNVASADTATILEPSTKAKIPAAEFQEKWKFFHSVYSHS